MNEAIVKAMVIGDGQLQVHPTCNNAHFATSHSVAQRDYCLWEFELLKQSGFPAPLKFVEWEQVVTAKTGKRNTICAVVSGVHPELTRLYQLMYPKDAGFKPGVLDDIDELGLAIIFMDDGGKQVNRSVGTTWHGKRYRYTCEPFIGRFQISLQSHGRIGCEQFKAWLLERFGIRSVLLKQPTEKGWYIGITRNADKERFRSIVMPHIHPTLLYKLEGSFKSRSIAPIV